jgi:hypothetical protein
MLDATAFEMDDEEPAAIAGHCLLSNGPSRPVVGTAGAARIRSTHFRFRRVMHNQWPGPPSLARRTTSWCLAGAVGASGLPGQCGGGLGAGESGVFEDEDFGEAVEVRVVV